MDSFGFPGFPDWKKIGWHIGKRLKDILNPYPDESRPSKEERRVQRSCDSHKGLVYFDQFDEIISWSISDIDPVQQANQPLIPRASVSHRYHGQPKTKVILCHDYHGGYHDYESVRPHGLDLDMYSCEYLQFVDTFVYFSHKLLCIPPPTWTNLLHRNGVTVLASLVIEPQTPSSEQLLTRQDGVFTVAKKLAAMAEVFNFDGWLLNIEKRFPNDLQNWFHDLIDFIDELRRLLGPSKQLVWYDALTCDGKVCYQNGLTRKNNQFAQAAGALFTNYKWTLKTLAESRAMAEANGTSVSDVFVGIDVWAQNTDMPGPPRVTYPPNGGGGTNTGLAMQTLSENGLSTAIFGAAWPFEHFSTSSSPSEKGQKATSIARRVDQSMWTGVSLPDELQCDCRKGRPHHSLYYQMYPISKFAQEFTSGSATFFETSFRSAFTVSEIEGQRQTWPLLSSQDVLPNLLPVSGRQWAETMHGPMTRVLYGEYSKATGSQQRSVQILTRLVGCYEEPEAGPNPMEGLNPDHQRPILRLRLFDLNMPADGSLQAVVEAHTKQKAQLPKVGFYTAHMTATNQHLEYFYYNELPTKSHSITRLSLGVEGSDARVVEFGIFLDGTMESSEPVTLIEMTSLVIKPIQAIDLDNLFTIKDVRVVERRQHPNVEKRLAWAWGKNPRHLTRSWAEGMPWSHSTGPFASFSVVLGGETIGQAYCLEFPLCREDLEKVNDEDDVAVQIIGNLFGGGQAEGPRVRFGRRELMVEGQG